MNVKDYKHIKSLNFTGRNDIYFIAMSNKDDGMFHDIEKETEEVIDTILPVLKIACLEFEKRQEPVIVFLDVDTARSRRGFSMFPSRSRELTDYEFPDPNSMPTYEESMAE